MKIPSLLALTLALNACVSMRPAQFSIQVPNGFVHTVGDSVKPSTELVKKDTVVNGIHHEMRTDFLWSSSNYQVVSVDALGTKVAFRKPGKASICANPYFNYTPGDSGVKNVLRYAPFDSTCVKLTSRAK